MRVAGERTQLLRALVGLRLEPALLGVVLELVALEEVGVVDLDELLDGVLRLGFAHRGLGSPLKVTGTRAGASSLRSG